MYVFISPLLGSLDLKATQASTMLSRILLLSSFVYEINAVRETPIGDDNVLALPDGFDDGFTHFHVSPTTHRFSMEQSAQVPVLAVVFSLRPLATVLRLVLPPGYELVASQAGRPGSRCAKVFSPTSPEQMSAYANETQAQPLTEHIAGCEASTTTDFGGTRVQLSMLLSPTVVGLSEKPKSQDMAYWWYFHILARFPAVSPEAEANFFSLSWANDKESEWRGDTRFRAWPVLGDWQCIYSDWEGWGTCSARCGGGTQTLRRRVLLTPPEGGVCSDIIAKDATPCNVHPCLFPCEFEEAEERGNCSAACGGGVRVVRRRWKGENCPASHDLDAVQLEQCNTQPCVEPCKLSDTWTVVTECSELCGRGSFWVMRKVLQKNPDDVACQPVWRELPCVNEVCTPLAIMRPDPNILPFPRDTFVVAVSFTTTESARRIELSAPESEGYSFGPPGVACELKDHSLMPHFERCEVGSVASKVILHLSTPLPPSRSTDDHYRYEFKIEVVNPDCDDSDWDPDPLRSTMTCNVGPDRSRWKLELASEGSDAKWESLSAQGYSLYWPGNDQGRGQVFLDDQHLDGDNGDNSKALVEESSSPRRDFCSTRMPCQDANSRCSWDRGTPVCESQS